MNPIYTARDQPPPLDRSRRYEFSNTTSGKQYDSYCNIHDNNRYIKCLGEYNGRQKYNAISKEQLEDCQSSPQECYF